ncbi:MAG: type VI secretion system tube protein TssD [Candidatus Latescibacterota bacterium]|jgi:hypothetical protein
MFMRLEFGDKEYSVTNYNFSLGTLSGDTKLSNVVPGELSVNIELPPEANPAEEFLQFAVDQHNTAKDKGAGVLTVFKGADVGESLQTIEFTQAWITDIDMSVSEIDEKFNVSLRFAAASMVISGVNFAHRGRAEHFGGR